MYQEIKNRVEKAECLGTDETGAKVNGKKHWFWTWQNKELTFIIQSPSRGYKTIAETFPNGLPNSPARDKLEQSLTELLLIQLPDKDNLAIMLQKKLRKICHHILYFLHNNHVQPDNNGSEQAIRTLKVKQKVSGGFRFIEGADGFAVIRSIIDTVIKSGHDVFHSLSLIAILAIG